MLREVKTENGWVRGMEAGDPRITAFKGIPFAAPPVGENRWRAPQPAADWEGVREAYRFAPISVQDTPGLGTDIYCREWHVDPDIAMAEDCLYLNVWTGAKNAGEKQPVLVWFFGGAFQWGYPAEMEFDGERIARRGVVVVTVNYRVNIFGFLAHPELTAQQPEAPANFGCLDQQAGLKWVIRNIAAFGGDPGNITIAGQSAGGASVMLQMTCPDNFGLFQRAIVMSGMIRNPYEKSGFGTPQPLSGAQKNGEDFFRFLGVKNLKEARELDALFIRDRYAEYAKEHPRMGTVEDHRFCFGDPLVLFWQGKHAAVPVMAGNTADEFPGLIRAESEEELAVCARELFGEKADVFLAQPEALAKSADGYAAVNGIECTVKSLFLQEEQQKEPQNCYYYRFDADIPGWDAPGTFHSVDLWFFFETLAKCWRPFVGRHYDLARQMCNYWCNFIRTGDPNGTDADGSRLPEWKSYTCNHPCEMVFTSEGAVSGEESRSGLRDFLVEQMTERFAAGAEEADALRRERMRPVWLGGIIYRETFAMITDGETCSAPFAFVPEEILSVESYDGTVIYDRTDYELKDGMLVLTENSRIPHTGWETFRHPDLETAQAALRETLGGPGFGPVELSDGGYLNLSAISHPEFVTRWQVAVTYRTKECWDRVHSQMDRLPRFAGKLRRDETVRVVVYGDSISCGYDCSGMYGQQPGQPIWPELVRDSLQARSKGRIEWINTSVGGVDTEWAIAHAADRAASYAPDLVILGFGMNDRCGGDVYREKTQRLMEEIRKGCPEVEFVLIATTLPNQEVPTPPLFFTSHQGEYSQSLQRLGGEGVAVADVQAVQRRLEEKKCYLDLTGNLLNHPNDFLSRVQAQVLDVVLGGGV